jgi:hypothetical protein
VFEFVKFGREDWIIVDGLRMLWFLVKESGWVVCHFASKSVERHQQSPK